MRDFQFRKVGMSLDIEIGTDLIKDERGNYYVAVRKDGRELTLVNALAERSYTTLLEFDEEFKRKHAEYEHQFVGKIAMDALRHDVVFASVGKGPGRIYGLEEVSEAYQVDFIDMIEFYRHPRMGRGLN